MDKQKNPNSMSNPVPNFPQNLNKATNPPKSVVTPSKFRKTLKK